MQELWADVTEDGELVIDWERAIENAMAFDQGERDYEAALGKLLIAVQRMSFERGYDAGCCSNDPRSRLLSLTMGNA